MQNIRAIAPLAIDFLYFLDLLFRFFAFKSFCSQSLEILLFTFYIVCLDRCFNLWQLILVKLQNCFVQLNLILCCSHAVCSRRYIICIRSESRYPSILNIIDRPIASEYAHEISVRINRTPRPHFCFCFQKCYWAEFIELIIHNCLSFLVLDPKTCK